MNKSFKKYNDFISESNLNEESSVESRIKELSKDPEVKKAIGGSEDKIKDALLVLFKRGYGAAKTNWYAVHPTIKKLGKGPAAYNAWGHARLNAFIKKKKGYSTSDKDVADWLKGKGPKPEPLNESLVMLDLKGTMKNEFMNYVDLKQDFETAKRLFYNNGASMLTHIQSDLFELRTYTIDNKKDLDGIIETINDSMTSFIFERKGTFKKSDILEEFDWRLIVKIK